MVRGRVSDGLVDLVLLSSLVLSLIFGILVVLAHDRSQPDPEVIYGDLRIAARDFVLADSGNAVSRPELSIDGGVLYYSLGWVNSSRLGLADDDPYFLPVATLILTQALQSVFKPHPLGNRFIEGHIGRLDSISLSMVRGIVDTEEDRAARERLLAGYSAQVAEEFGSIDAKVRDYAQQNNLRPQRVGRSPASDYYSVSVSTRPPGGVVTVLPWLDYRKRLALRQREDQMPWRTLVQQREDLVGRYACRIRWRDGQNYAGDFHVRNASPINIPTR